MEDLALWSIDDCKRTTGGYEKSARSITPISSDASASSALLSASMASSQTLLPLPKVHPKGIESGAEVTPQLILDGARAPAAFCRPFPVATVGEPLHVEFDISSTSFKFRVRVRPDDTQGVTEIYVPFVHYAKELDWEGASDDSSRQNSQLSLVSMDGTPTLSKYQGRPLELDINVTTSVGTWTVSGQYLYWSYPIPTRPTTYSIEIKRNGGQLPFLVAEKQPTWWDTLEQYGCTIA